MEVFKENTTFVVSVDNDILKLRTIMNAGEHTHRLKKIFGDETRLMIDKSEAGIDFGKLKKHKTGGYSAWVYQDPIYLKVTKGRFHRRLFFYEFFNEEKFKDLAKKLIFVEQVNK